jgi:predicted nucleotidyltransferase
VTTPSEYLVALARHIADVYRALCAPRAILLAGSCAEGLADTYSDIDLIVYYATTLPSEAHLAAVRNEIGADSFRPLFPREEGRSCGEAYRLNGVECQVAHSIVADVEDRLTPILDGSDPASRFQKAIMGHLHGLPLYGDDLIHTWRAREANFSDQLARRMVEHHLSQIFPLWYITHGLEQRDAQLWVRQTLAETALSVIGVLAGLNRHYYVGFQFKRTQRFVDSLPIAPDNVANRLNAALVADQSTAIIHMEAIVAETLALVHQHMPEVDTQAVIRHQPGARQAPWHLPTPTPTAGDRL